MATTPAKVDSKEEDKKTSTLDEVLKKNEQKKEEEKKDKDAPYVSPAVVALDANKTPAELAAESPEEAAVRYNIDNTISDEDADNPRVQVYRDTLVNQVPSGTHLHPDIAKDHLNRGIAEQTTDSAQVKRQIIDTYDFAPDAEFNDKYQA